MRRRSFLQCGAVALGGVPIRIDARDGGRRAFEPLGRLPIDGLSEVVVDESGTIAYGALRTGFVVVDVSDPSAPTIQSRVTDILPDVAGGPIEDIFDVKVSGDRLLVAGPRHGSGRTIASGFEVYDVSDPSNPERVAGAETAHAVHNAFIDGETVYLTGTGAPGEPLVIYEVGGDAPAEVARWSIEDGEPAWARVPSTFHSCHDVFVQGSIAYVAYWDGGTWLVDVSDPANPSAIAGFGGVPPTSLAGSTSDGFPSGVRELPGNSHYVEPSPDGSLVAVGKEAWDDEETPMDGGPGGIGIWDLSDPTAPSRISVLAPPGRGHTSHNFGWRGDRLYTSWYGGGVRVFDLSDPESPSLVASWADEGRTAFWTAKPATEAVVASSYADPRNDREAMAAGVGAALYTFPDPVESSGRPAETLTPRPTPIPTPTPTLPTTAAEELSDSSGATEPETDTDGTRRATDRGTTSAPSATTRASSGTGSQSFENGGTPTGGGTGGGRRSTPGFGLLATLVGGGIAAWRLAARRGPDEK